MANKAISELPQAQNVNNQDLFVLEQSGIAKKLTAETFITEQGIIDALAEALDGHGGIASVALASVSGRIRTYRITFTDQSTTTFQVYDGTSIERISRTSSSGLDDVYTVFLSDGTTTFFTVHNGADGSVSEAMLNDALKNKAPVITETTESSAIANFADGADDLVMHNIVAEIAPVQSGSGDPSPSNIRPISGWTGCNVTRTGKNLFDADGLIGNTCTETDGIYTITKIGSGANSRGTAYAPMQLKKGVEYTISFVQDRSGLPTRSFSLRYTWEVDGVTNYSSGFAIESGATFVTLTPTTDTDAIQFYISSGSSGIGEYVSLSNIQIEIGSTATAYEPYQGTSVAVSWQTEAGTVYGGTIDVATGLLTVTKASVTVGDLTVYSAFQTGTYSCIKRYRLPNNANSVPYNTTHGAISDMGIEANAYFGSVHINEPNSASVDFAINTDGSLLAIYDPDTAITESDFNTKYAGMQIVYPLATPQTYQLTPQQLMTLLGTNNVWTDIANVSVTYPVDTKMYIEKLTIPSEDDLVANQAITSGQYFMIGNSLYLALANIASGAQITIGTNAQRVSLADALNTINS